jgi:hypothetical protein
MVSVDTLSRDTVPLNAAILKLFKIVKTYVPVQHLKIKILVKEDVENVHKTGKFKIN